MSLTLEKTQKEEPASEAKKTWLQENQSAINTYNEFIEEYGCFSDDYRDF